MGSEGLTLSVEVEIIGLILVALLVYIIARRIRIPYTIALVLAGIGLSLFGTTYLHEIFPIGLSTDLILLVFLPGLIFEAAYHLNLNNLMQNIWLILGLAVPGLLVSAGIVGGVIHWALGVPLEVALLFVGLISATDPISVLALFKELRVPKRLSVLMEGESLFNDGTAVVVFLILMDIVSGEPVTLTSGVSRFVIVMLGGALTGFTIGMLVNYLLEYVADDNPIQIALTIIMAYGTFLLAEEALHVSPVIAVVVAGVTLGSNQRKPESSLGAQISIVDFWELVAFLINSAIFLLIGLESPLPLLMDSLGNIMIAIAAIIGARALVVYATGWLSRRFSSNPIPRHWDRVLFWGGLRGSVSLALALSLPATFVWRDTVLALTLGYVTFSLVVGGLTMKPVLKQAGLTRRSQTRERWESLLAQLRMVQATQQSIERLSQQHLLPPSLDENFRHAVDRTLEGYWTEMERLLLDDPNLLRERTEYILNEIVRDRRASLLELVQRGFITEYTYHDETEKLILQAQEALVAENSEQVFAILSGLIGQWDRVRHLRQLLRDSPVLTSQLVKAHLSQAAHVTLDELVDQRQTFAPFVAEELRPFVADLQKTTEQQMNRSIQENPEVHLQATRLVMHELLEGQRSTISQMLRTGLLSEREHVKLSQQLDSLADLAGQMTTAQELNALMLLIPSMIRNLDETLETRPLAEVRRSPEAEPEPVGDAVPGD
jgi:CPA1 family monovalent cation:H+ antiporter